MKSALKNSKIANTPMGLSDATGKINVTLGDIEALVDALAVHNIAADITPNCFDDNNYYYGVVILPVSLDENGMPLTTVATQDLIDTLLGNPNTVVNLLGQSLARHSKSDDKTNEVMSLDASLLLAMCEVIPHEPFKANTHQGKMMWFTEHLDGVPTECRCESVSSCFGENEELLSDKLDEIADNHLVTWTDYNYNIIDEESPFTKDTLVYFWIKSGKKELTQTLTLDELGINANQDDTYVYNRLNEYIWDWRDEHLQVTWEIGGSFAVVSYL